MAIDYSKYGGKIIPAKEGNSIDYSKYGGTVKPYQNDSEPQEKSPWKFGVDETTSAKDILRNLAVGLTRGGEKIEETVTGRPAKYGHIDPEKAYNVGDKNRSETLQTLAQYAPLFESAGAGVPMMAATAGGYGVTQHPELPTKERLFEGAKDAGMTAMGGYLAEPAFAMAKAAPSVAKKMVPNALKDAWESLTKSIDAKSLARTAQQSHDKLKNEAVNIFRDTKKEFSNRNLPPVQLPKSYIDSARKHLPETEEIDKLLKKAESGDFNAIRQLQSELGQEGSSYSGSKLITEKKTGKEILDLRRQINKATEDHLNAVGANDLSGNIKSANDMYTKMHETYYKHPTIRSMVDKSKGRIIPRNPMTAFSEESDRIKPFHNEHPEIKEAVDLTENKKRLMKKLKIPLGLGVLGSSDALVRWLLNR